MHNITIKYSTLFNLLIGNIGNMGEAVINEARKMGKIDIIDDISGKKISEIPFREEDVR